MTVIVPFAGGAGEAATLVARLRALRTRPGDAVVVVDNTANGVATEVASAPVRVIAADLERSSYYARNVGAEASATPWLLFLDADCAPCDAGLLDSYFERPIPARTGLVAGRVDGAPSQQALVARYSRSRRHLDQRVALAHPHRPFAVTANLLVRKETWADLGGFCEGIRSAGDQDFSWRAGMAGWALEYREAAAVEHAHREDIGALARQFRRYGAGVAWLRRRHTDAPSRRPRLARRLPASAFHGISAALKGDLDEAVFRALDVVLVCANNVGYLLGNRAARPRDGATAPRAAFLVGTYPDPDDPALAEEVDRLVRDGVPVMVEAIRRPWEPRAAAVRDHLPRYAEDDGALGGLADVLWLVGRHPVRAIRHARGPVPLRALASRTRRAGRARGAEVRP